MKTRILLFILIGVPYLLAGLYKAFSLLDVFRELGIEVPVGFAIGLGLFIAVLIWAFFFRKLDCKSKILGGLTKAAFAAVALATWLYFVDTVFVGKVSKVELNRSAFQELRWEEFLEAVNFKLFLRSTENGGAIYFASSPGRVQKIENLLHVRGIRVKLTSEGADEPHKPSEWRKPTKAQ